MTVRTPYNIRKIATRVIVEGADVKRVQQSQDTVTSGCRQSSLRLVVRDDQAELAYVAG